MDMSVYVQVCGAAAGGAAGGAGQEVQQLQ